SLALAVRVRPFFYPRCIICCRPTMESEATSLDFPRTKAWNCKSRWTFYSTHPQTTGPLQHPIKVNIRLKLYFVIRILLDEYLYSKRAILIILAVGSLKIMIALVFR